MPKLVVVKARLLVMEGLILRIKYNNRINIKFGLIIYTYIPEALIYEAR